MAQVRSALEGGCVAEVCVPVWVIEVVVWVVIAVVIGVIVARAVQEARDRGPW